MMMGKKVDSIEQNLIFGWQKNVRMRVLSLTDQSSAYFLHTLAHAYIYIYFSLGHLGKNDGERTSHPNNVE